MAEFGILLVALAWLGSVAAVPVEVVLAHFNEDLTWIEAYKHNDIAFTIYSKSSHPPSNTTSLPNVGRESHTYLYHICSNYNSLAEWTVFSPAVRPAWGIDIMQPARSGHLTDEVTFADYLSPIPEGKDSFFALSKATLFPSVHDSTRLGYMLPGKKKDKGLCPDDGAKGWTPWNLEPTHPHRQRSGSGPSLMDFYHSLIALDEPHDAPIALAYTQGARFAVSRERVLRRPLEYYAELLLSVSSGVDPEEGYWMEVSWYDIFHPEAVQSRSPACPLPPVPGLAA